jgi:hypothetical protein
MGLPKLGEEPAGHVSETIMKSTPFVAVGWASILAGIWWVVGRRNKMMSKNGSRE